MPDHTIAGERWRISEVTLADGRSVGLAEFGRESGFPIFWFHGTPGARRQVPAQAMDHADRVGARIIGVDRPGIGGSSKHHLDRVIDYAADAAEVAQALGVERFGLIGLSGGGPYVLAVCAAMPEQVVAAAVLGGVAQSAGPEKATGGPVPLLRPFTKVLVKIREPLAIGATAAIKLATPAADFAFDLYMKFGPKSDRDFLARPEMREMFLVDLLTASQVSFRAIIYDVVLFSRWWGFDVSDVQTPVYFWHGDSDLIVPLSHGEQLADLVPNSWLWVIPGQGHLAMLDAGEDAIDVIMSHVASGDAAAPTDA